jgi:hypothetical protein
MAEEMLANYWWSVISPCTVAPPSNGGYILKMPDLDEEGNEASDFRLETRKGSATFFRQRNSTNSIGLFNYYFY